MILIIRIAGMVNVPGSIEQALFRWRLRRKYSAVLIEDNPVNQKILVKIRNHVSYGEISDEMLKSLKEKRQEKDKKFFRLHPPIGGIDSKKHFGVQKGVLGYNPKINDLVRRML